MKKKTLILPVALTLLLAACDGGVTEIPSIPSSDDDSSESLVSEDIPSSSGEISSESALSSDEESSSSIIESPDYSKIWEEMLKKDYSNSTSYNVETSEGEAGYPYSEYNYKGYNIIDDMEYAATYGEHGYLYYHDYEGESHLYFEDDYGNGDAWLKEGFHNAPIGIEHSYLDVATIVETLAEVPLDKVSYGNNGIPNYYITDEETMAEINRTLLSANTLVNAYYEYLCINVDTDTSTLEGIIAFVDYSSDPDYAQMAMIDIGGTTFDDTLLPPAPTPENVKTYAEFSGTEPWVEEHVTSITIGKDGSTDPIALDPDEEVTVTRSYLPESANTMLFSAASSNEDVAVIEHGTVSGTYLIKAIHPGTAEISITDDISGVVSNKLVINVNEGPDTPLDGIINLASFKSYDESTGIIAYDENITAANPITIRATDIVDTIDVRAHGTNSDLLPKNEDADLLFLEYGSGGPNDPKPSIDVTSEDNVTGVSFFYGYEFADHINNIGYMDHAYIETSTDGENYEIVEDWIDEFKANASVYNMKLKTVEFDAPVSHVRIRFNCNYVGKANWIVLQELGLYGQHAPEGVPLESISLAAPEGDIEIGDEFTITASLAPSNTTQRDLVFSSLDPTIVEVVDAANGRFKALKEGTTTIKAVNPESGIEASIEITVKEPHIPVVVFSAAMRYGIPDASGTYSVTMGGADSRYIVDVTYTIDDVEQTSGVTAEFTTGDGLVEVVDGVLYCKPTVPGDAVVTITAADGSGRSTTIAMDVKPCDIDNDDYSGTFDHIVATSKDWNDDPVTSVSVEFTANQGEVKITLNPGTDSAEEVLCYCYDWDYMNGASMRSYDETLALDFRIEQNGGDLDITSIDMSWYIYVGRSYPLTGVTLSSSSTTPTVGDTFTVTVRPDPAYTTDDITVVWSIEGTSVTPDGSLGNGLTQSFIADSEGVSTISVLVNGTLDATIEITVEASQVTNALPAEFIGNWVNDDGDEIEITADELIFTADVTNGMFYSSAAFVSYDAATGIAVFGPDGDYGSFDFNVYFDGDTLCVEDTGGSYYWYGLYQA